MTDFVERFREVTFRFEFDEKRSCFLISYSVPSHLWDEEDVWDELFSFKSRIRDEFGKDAPIFMEGESICKLSSKAQLIQFEEKDFSVEEMFQFEEPILLSANSFVYEAQLIQFEEKDFSFEDMFQFEESIFPSANSFFSKDVQNYTFSIKEDEACFFGGYPEYLCAA